MLRPLQTNDVVEFGNSWVSNAFNCKACQGDACVKYTGGFCLQNPALDSQVKAACDPIKNPSGRLSLASRLQPTHWCPRRKPSREDGEDGEDGENEED